MLTRNLTYENSAIGKRVRTFGLDLRSSPPAFSRGNRLFFLCGANQNPGKPSARREAIKTFAEGVSPEYRVIYAEGIFNELARLGQNKNALDLEHEISAIADKILIVLESPSAFCELGAFAHPTLRKKLVIINDSKFRGSNSFIETGPIAAATEAKSPTLWYPMGANGITETDGIGTIFSDLADALDTRATATTTFRPARPDDLGANKYSLYFIHDLVLFFGPVSNKEVIAILIEAFGKKNFDMAAKLLGVLREARLIVSHFINDTWVYRAVGTTPFLRYSTDIDSLMATFRRFHWQSNPERFSHV
ncbi:retron St85 family effector protein [Burkholderia ubonensis]|uniref:retron St85 family effector protein n=1 Tax=Burkholderia ubonensis TaxID=101571 RepID=UPI0010547809|nr:retron St85 family effector protein [Burkholderia ubonensis]